MKQPPQYISLPDLEASLVLPDGTIASRSSVYLYLKKLDIKPTKLKLKDKGWARAHVTAAEAQIVMEDFKRTHWRKFKLAEGKK
jgi:hypothetical protein